MNLSRTLVLIVSAVIIAAIPAVALYAYYTGAWGWKLEDARLWVSCCTAAFTGWAFLGALFAIYTQSKQHREQMEKLERQIQHAADAELRKAEPRFDFERPGEFPPIHDLLDRKRVFSVRATNTGQNVRIVSCVSESYIPRFSVFDDMLLHLEDELELLENEKVMTITFDSGKDPAPFEFTIRYKMPDIGRFGWQKFKCSMERGVEKIDSGIELPPPAKKDCHTTINPLCWLMLKTGMASEDCRKRCKKRD